MIELPARNGAATDLMPPTDEQLEAVRAFERSVASGEWFEALMESVGPDAVGPDRKRQMCAGGEAEGSGLELDPGQRRSPLRGALVLGDASAPHDERLRLRISDEQAGWWRYLERVHARNEWRLRAIGDDVQPISFIEFACMAVWLAWYPSIKATGQFDRWTSVYVRDRHRCSSPLCSRRDVTPHHLRFQSHGGGHEDENVASLCSWCHLDGVHGGRIVARPPASKIHWRFGRAGEVEPTVVRGRELLAGEPRA